MHKPDAVTRTPPSPRDNNVLSRWQLWENGKWQDGKKDAGKRVIRTRGKVMRGENDAIRCGEKEHGIETDSTVCRQNQQDGRWQRLADKKMA